MSVDPRGRHWKAWELAKLCYDVGWTDADRLLIAVSVCIAEANGYEHRRNYNPVILNADGSVKVPASVDRGGWAINDRAHPEVTDAEADDFPTATRWARRMYVARGNSFRAWAAFNNDQYKGQRAMGYAFDGVANFLRERHGYPLP